MVKRKRSEYEPILFRVAEKISSNTRYQERISKTEENAQPVVTDHDRYQLELFLKPAPEYKDCFPLPTELLIKIFYDLVTISDNPIRELFQLSRVCEAWREIVLFTPYLWFRLDLTTLPLTERNLNTIDGILTSNPNILKKINEVSLSGQNQPIGQGKTGTIILKLLSAPNIRIFNFRHVSFATNSFAASVQSCIKNTTQIEHLTFTESNNWLMHHTKWLCDLLSDASLELQELNLSMSLNTIPNQLIRLLTDDSCPNLKFLDLSTCDMINTHTFDATLLAKSLPKLEVLRLGNVSFKRIDKPPDIYHMKRLRELSIPVLIPDSNRDDALLATLAYGSTVLESLDIRGSSVSTNALIDLPAPSLRELHMDDIFPSRHQDYHRIIKRWSGTLENLSLVRINCDKTMETCIKALCSKPEEIVIREIDLTSSGIGEIELKQLIDCASKLRTVNISSCRSLPRGWKGIYTRDAPIARKGILPMSMLLKKMK